VTTALHQNYPNPFNPTTTISFDLSFSSHVSVRVYDLLGTEVLSLLDEHRSRGSHQLTLNAEALTSGVYFYRLSAGSFTQTKKITVLK
jgi:hypothetical protein